MHFFFFFSLPGPPTLKQRNKELKIIFQETKEIQGQLFVHLATVLLNFSSILLPSSLGIIRKRNNRIKILDKEAALMFSK